jgi:hypothetical protein
MTFGVEDSGDGRQSVYVKSNIEFCEQAAPPKGRRGAPLIPPRSHRAEGYISSIGRARRAHPKMWSGQRGCSRELECLGWSALREEDGALRALLSPVSRQKNPVRPREIEASPCRGTKFRIVASRVSRAAHPGVILVTKMVKDLSVGAGIRFVARGSPSLTGVSEKWCLHSVGKS